MREVFSIVIPFLIALSALAKTNTKKETNFGENPVIAGSISNQQITSIAEDAFGHIWIGTIRGLNKFNVYEYQQYFNVGDSTGISDNRVQHVYKDSKNQLWVATVNGVCRYSDRDCFEQVPIEGPSTNAYCFFENNTGRLFLNLFFAVNAYNPETNTFELVIDDIDKDNYFTQCFVDKSNKIWVVKPFEIRCYNSDTYELKDSFKLDRQITFAYLDEKDELWLGSWTHLIKFDTKTRQFIPLPQEIANHSVLSKSIIVSMYAYNNSSTLIQTQDEGMFLYNRINGTVVHQSENGFPFEVPDVEITTLFTDSQKNLWIGSFDHGFTVRYNYKRRFNNNNYLVSMLEGKSVISVATSKNNVLWMITRSKGLVIYNNETKESKTVSNKELYAFLNSGFHHRAKRLMADNENNMWILSDRVLLCTRYEDGKVVVKKWYHFSSRIMSMAQDIRGTIWLGSFNEDIYAMKKGEARFQPFYLYGKGFSFTPDIISLSSGKVLIASFDKELQLIDPDTWGVSTIPIKQHIKYSKFIPVYLFEDSEGDIWIGTLTNGLFCYSPENRKIQHLEGTACSDITSITEDVSGNIWVGTLYGLSKFDRTTHNFLNYYKTDGIGGNQFNEQCVCRMPDNSLILGGTHGITYFNPIEVGYKRSVPLLFENLWIHNKLVLPFAGSTINMHLSYNPDIQLNHKQNSFTISYTAIDYGEYERVKYAYKLDGFDDFWIEANKSHQAYYSNIPPGKYTFRVKIYNDENTVIETENAIAVKIKRPPWFTRVALAFYLIVLYLIIAYIVRIFKRIKINKEMALQAERDKEQEHKVNKMNMSFFSNLSHEFRTPLTMISGPVTLLSKDKTISGEGKKLLFIVQRNVTRMLRLVNQLMDFNKLENDTLKLKVKLTDVIGELLQIVDIFRLNIEEKGIELNIHGLEDNYIMWLDSDKLDKIVTNLIANALKFSEPGGKIGIVFDVITRDVASRLFRLSMNDRGFQYAKISVTDTGRGIPDDKLVKIFERYYQLDNQTREFYNWGTGIGLYYAHRLVELHHGKIKAANRQEGGSEFSFILPIDDIAYTDEERLNEEGKQKAHEIPLPIQDRGTFEIITENTNAKQKLLIIDDDTEIVHYLRALLCPYFDISYKFDADSAYKSLKEVEPELILCDVVMPGTDGYSFSLKVKENPSYCHIPIILVTAKVTVDNQVEGLNSGADAYVTKPFDPAYLIALINSQLENRKKIQSLLGSTTKAEKIDRDVLSPHDKIFMTSLYDLMEKELSNPELNINRITEVLKISRTKFYYKVKGLTGENPNVFFKTYKLNRAAELLLDGNNNISEIADITGFSTLSHFSVSFKKQFGVSPSAYNQYR